MSLKEKLLIWECVPQDQELEKYFRYKCFQLKFLKTLPSSHTEEGYKLLNFMYSEGQKGIDVVRTIWNLLHTEMEAELRNTLTFSLKAITDRNLSLLSEDDIKTAQESAMKSYIESLNDVWADED